MSGMGEKVRAGSCRIRGSANPTPRQPTPCWDKHHNSEPERLVVSEAPRQDFVNHGRAASASSIQIGTHNGGLAASPASRRARTCKVPTGDSARTAGEDTEA